MLKVDIEGQATPTKYMSLLGWPFMTAIERSPILLQCNWTELSALVLTLRPMDENDSQPNVRPFWSSVQPGRNDGLSSRLNRSYYRGPQEFSVAHVNYGDEN